MKKPQDEQAKGQNDFGMNRATWQRSRVVFVQLHTPYNAK